MYYLGSIVNNKENLQLKIVYEFIEMDISIHYYLSFLSFVPRAYPIHLEAKMEVAFAGK